MSGRIAKSQIPIRAQASLPADAVVGLITAKNQLKAGVNLREFGNSRGNASTEGPPLPEPSLGCTYVEADAGHAHPADPRSQRGAWRFVFEFNPKSRQILETYYTEDHYGKFTFFRVV